MHSSEQLIEQLFEWQPPELMQERVDVLAELLGNDAMQRRGKAFREAWVAARFAYRADQEEVRLLREEQNGTTSDFAVRSGNVTRRYETTEADVPGRKRQLEYRSPVPAGVQPMIMTSLDAIVEQMRLITSRKKRYMDCAGLVVHLNPPMFSFNPEFRTESMRLATEPASIAFREVWLLRDKGVLLWLEGKFLGWVPDDF